MMENLLEEYNEKIKEKDVIIENLRNKLEVTEQKLNELNRNLEQRIIERTVEVNRLLKNKTRFIDNLSHDLGTPITPLVTLLPLIKEEMTDPRTKEILDTCIRNAEYLRLVVMNTRKLAEISSLDFILE